MDVQDAEYQRRDAFQDLQATLWLIRLFCLFSCCCSCYYCCSCLVLLPIVVCCCYCLVVVVVVILIIHRGVVNFTISSIATHDDGKSMDLYGMLVVIVLVLFVVVVVVVVVM